MNSVMPQRQCLLKMNNCKMVMRILRDNRDKLISRADLAKFTEMSPTSITRLIRQLIELNLVNQENPFSKGVGRNGTQVCINKDAFYSIGICIDSDFLHVCIVNCVDEVLAEASFALEEKFYYPEALLNKAKLMLEELINENEIERQRIKALGIACAGNVDPEAGIIHSASQMGWKNIELKDLAQQVFGYVTCVDNDVKMGLIGATYQFPSMRSSDAVYVSVGAGVGAAVMYNGKLVRGMSNAVGEVGHMHFATEGRRCDCGRNDCTYTYLSTQALLKLCKKKGHEIIDLDMFLESLHAKEEWVQEVVEEYTDYLAIFLADMIYIYNPKYLLVGGTLITSDDIFFRKAKDKLSIDFRNMMYNKVVENMIIKKRELKNNGAIGAACSASEIKILKMIEETE